MVDYLYSNATYCRRAYVRQIPAKCELSPKALLKDMAIQHNAAYACPVTTGIFLRIIAEAAFEEYQNMADI